MEIRNPVHSRRALEQRRTLKRSHDFEDFESVIKRRTKYLDEPEPKRRRMVTEVDEEDILYEEDVAYEDTDPEEYAKPVYRGKFWLYSIELAKLVKLENQYTHNPSIFSDSYSLSNNSDGIDGRPDEDTYSQWDDKAIPPLPANNYTSEVDGPRLPPRVDNENQNFQLSRPKNEEALTSYNKTTKFTDVPRTKEKCSDKKKIKKKVVTLYCNHCEKSFKAKPTFRPKFMHYLVNHACSNVKRHQYVVGVKHRKCPFSCDAVLGCICLASRRKLKLSNLASRPPLVTLKNS